MRLTAVKAYLLAIARNLWLMERRRSLRFQGLDEAIPASERPMSRQVEAKDDLERVPRALRELP